MSQAQPLLPHDQVEEIIVGAIRTLNLSRRNEDRLQESAEASLYGAGSPLDSLGLVSLLIEVEEGLRDAGLEISLSDERAMSQRHSPFRTVQTLAAYIEQSSSNQSI